MDKKDSLAIVDNKRSSFGIAESISERMNLLGNWREGPESVSSLKTSKNLEISPLFVEDNDCSENSQITGKDLALVEEKVETR